MKERVLKSRNLLKSGHGGARPGAGKPKGKHWASTIITVSEGERRLDRFASLPISSCHHKEI